MSPLEIRRLDGRNTPTDLRAGRGRVVSRLDIPGIDRRNTLIAPARAAEGA